MILVDTSVWVDHPRQGDPGLVDLLERSVVTMHPFVVGEIACASLHNREAILELLQDLPAAAVAEGDEVPRFIESHDLHGKGIGYVDVHLLASAALTEGARIWTRDKKLRLVAQTMGCAYQDTRRIEASIAAVCTASLVPMRWTSWARHDGLHLPALRRQFLRFEARLGVARGFRCARRA